MDLIVNCCVCTAGFPSRRYLLLPSNPLSGHGTCPARCLMNRWQWGAEGRGIEPTLCLLPGSWVLFPSPSALSAKNKCLTPCLMLFGLSFQELVLIIHFPARLQHTLVSPQENIFTMQSSPLPFPKHTKLFENLRERNFLQPSNKPHDLSLPFLGCFSYC